MDNRLIFAHALPYHTWAVLHGYGRCPAFEGIGGCRQLILFIYLMGRVLNLNGVEAVLCLEGSGFFID